MINHPDKNKHHSHDVFNNPQIFIEKFDAPERDEWQKPDEVITSFNLKEDSMVVDIGAGTGYFAVRIAPYVKNGKVIAFDQAPNMVSYIADRASKLGLSNVVAKTTRQDGSLELDEQADLIFLVDVYHHLEDRVAYFAKVAKHLKQNGILVVIDRTEEKISGQPIGHRVLREEVKAEMKEAGFKLIEERDFLLPIQYYLSFKRTS